MADKTTTPVAPAKNRFAQFKDYPHKESLSLPEHFSMISAQKSKDHDQAAHESLAADLKQHGYTPTEAHGNYGYDEKSYMVPHKGTDADHKTIEALGKKHGQQAVLHSSKGHNRLVFADGSPSWEGHGHVHGPFLDKYSTKLPSGHKFSLILKKPDMKKSDPRETYKQAVRENVDRATKASKPHFYGKIDGIHVFHSTHEAHHNMIGRHVHNPSDEDLQSALEDASNAGHGSVIIHGSPPPSLRSQALPAHHPHNYDWHDGHTDHIENDIKKHDGIKIPHHGNDQAAAAGVPTYKPIAEKFGSVVPTKKSNLQFYRGLEKHEPAIDHLIAKHGYQTYIAGGKEFGKPDLKAKNYNTGHLMIWNPKPDGGGDFGDENFTRSWRKLHELAHAMTYKDVNGIYGEGRRLGKLGVRTPNESKRAVHWEWLAAHKQRELAEGLGHKISDEDFHRELNTVMHDAVHRAVTGQFTEPSDEGFHPHAHKIDLETSLGMIDDHAKNLGLTHPHATKAGPAKATEIPPVKLNTSLVKGYFHEDGVTITQGDKMALAQAAVPERIMKWGAEKLASLPKDAIEILELDGRIIKVRKLLEDLYAGWIESDGQKIHEFQRVTLPELMQQIHSKLELYGRENDVVPGEAMSEKKAIIETKEDALEEEQALGTIGQKLKELHAMVDKFKAKEREEHAEMLPTSELTQGIENPETECPACERNSAECVCYTGLPKPRVEFDGKKLVIFFKSEWQEDDRENFVNDLKRRAGNIVLKKRMEEAREVRDLIKKRIDGRGKKQD